MISYYDCTSHTRTAGNIEWDLLIQNFSVQWKAIQDLKKNYDATLTIFLNTVSIVKLFTTYEYHASQVIGQAN